SLLVHPPPSFSLFPYTTLFRSSKLLLSVHRFLFYSCPHLLSQDFQNPPGIQTIRVDLSVHSYAEITIVFLHRITLFSLSCKGFFLYFNAVSPIFPFLRP